MGRPAGTSQEAWDAAGDIIVNHGNRTGTLVVSLQAPIARAIDAAILSAKAEQRVLVALNEQGEERAMLRLSEPWPIHEFIATIEDWSTVPGRRIAIRAGRQ